MQSLALFKNYVALVVISVCIFKIFESFMKFFDFLTATFQTLKTDEGLKYEKAINLSISKLHLFVNSSLSSFSITENEE